MTQEKAAEESKIPGIRWLASFPKSGNTWIRLLDYSYQFGKIKDINQVKGNIIGDLIPGLWYSASPIPWGILNNNQRLLVRYTALMNLIMCYTMKPYIVKTHCANLRFNSVDLIPDEITEKAVYIVRDPRDVAHSYAHHMGITIDEAIVNINQPMLMIHNDDGTGLMHHLSSWSNHVTSWLDSGAFERIHIKYEDLLVDTENQFLKVYETFYDRTPDRERIRKAIKHTSFNKLKKKERKYGFKEASSNGEFFRKGKAGTWQNILTEEQVRQIEQDHGEVMERVGYNLEYL